MKFTDRAIRSLKPENNRYIAWEDNGKGFGLRVSPQGKKTFIFMYRYQGRSRMMTLGEYPARTLADANLAHADALKKLGQGVDPGASQLEQKQIDRAAMTVKQLADDYLDKWAKPRKRSWKEDERIINKDILPRWKHRKAKDIQRRDVIALLDEVVNRGAEIQANRTFGIIRKMFNFAVSRDIVPYSPCAGVSPPSAERQRDRVLSEAEIRNFWHNLDKAKMHLNTKLAVKLILVTAQRAGEVIGAEWSEFDLKNGCWTIPAEKAKNKQPHRVPLSPLALELLAQVKPYSGESAYLFPSPKGRGKPKVRKRAATPVAPIAMPPKDRPIAESALGHALKKNLGTLAVTNVVPHDLRRTATSYIAAAGTPRLVVSKILNHVDTGVTAIYDRYGYDAEKRSALAIWAKKLSTILAGEEANMSNVIPIIQR